MPKSIGRKGIIAIVLALIAVIGVASLAFFTDRVDHSMQFTTASFSADGYELTRTAPEGPFCAGEEVTATLKESNTGDDDVNSIISMKATWVSPDTSLSIFGNANAADNATLSIGGTNVSYTVSADNKSVTFDLPKQVLAAGTKDAARDLTLTIPASFKSTGRIEFTFEKVVVAQEGGGFSREYSRTDLNAASDLDYSVKVGWAASSIAAQNGKALMGYLTDKNASGKFGIEFELAFNYTESPMKDFSSRTGAKWSYYKGAVDRLTFVEGMTTIGDYAFPDFSAVKSVSFPTTVKTIGLSAFDASGLTGTVTIPATVKEIKSLAFGNLPNAKTFTFGHTTDSLTLPDNTAAGKRNTGAFYVPTHVDTTVNTTVEAIMYGYKWHDGYDNRRLAPTLNAQDTWFRTYTSGSNYTAKLDENVLETITFADYHMPVTGETSWDASDPSVPGTVTAFLSADKKSLILAGNGYGLIFANEDSSGAFSSLTALKSVSNTDLLDTRNATTMADMFNFDKKLANISVTTWNVSKVTDMSNMFYCCDSLPSIDLKPNTCTAKDGSGQYTAWNTASLKNTSGMFMDYGGENHALTTVDTTGWDTSKLEDTSYMFMECRGLTAVKGIESWNVSSLKDAHNMFQDCQSLQTINVSNWNTASLENTSVMFGSCKALKSIDISKWDMSKVTKSNAMFVYCESFTELTLPKSLVVIGERFAGYCPKLTTITFNHPAGANIQMSSSAFIVENNGKNEGTTGYIEYTPVKPLGTKVVTSNQTVLDYDWTSDHRGYVVEIKTVEGGTLTGAPLTTYNGQKAVVAINGKTITFADTAEEAYAYDGATVQYSQGGTAKTVTLDKNTKTWVMPVVDDKVTEADVVVTPKWKVTAIPMLAKEDTWQYNGTDTNGDPTTPIDYDLLETINVVNKYTPAAGETSWDASANQTVDGVEYKGKVTVYLSADKKTLTISGNGYGKVFANPDSMWAMTKSRDGMSALKQISGANILDTQLVVNAGGMFAQNRKLESVDVSNWNTGKIQNTSAAGGYYGMFMNCAKLKVLDVSKWDTKSMTEMIRMFSGCETVTKLDVSGWKTSKVTHMNEMFSGTGISQIAVNGSGWDTSNLVKSYNMFEGCANLTQINLSTWNVSKLEDTSEMFADSGLTSIDLSMWDESIVNSVYGMFRNCKALTSVNLNGWNLSNLEDGTTDNRKGSAGMFSGCTALTELNIPASLKVFGQNFAANCTSLNKITFLHDAGTVLTFPTAGATYGAFYVDPAMRTTQIVGQNTSAKAYSWVKDQRAAIPTLAAQNTWYKGTTAKSAITGIEIVDSYSGASTESWDASAAQDGSVKAYINGTKLIIAGNGYGKVLANEDSTSAFNAFTNVTSFTGLNKLDTSNVTNMQTMFNNLDNIQTLDLSSFNTSKVTNFYSIFGGNDKLTTLNLTGWDTSAAKDMGQMFYSCSALTALDLSGFDTSNVTNMSYMFNGCRKLKSVTLGKDFKFVGTDGYLPTPSSTYISGADGKWYDSDTRTGYTPRGLASVTRNAPVTYVAVKPGPMLAERRSWYKSTKVTDKRLFKTIAIINSGEPSGTIVEQWNADVDNSGSIKAYITGSSGSYTLTIAGDGSGSIMANPDSNYAFSNTGVVSFSNVTSFTGTKLLNTSRVTDMSYMFDDCSALTSLDVSGFDTSRVTDMSYMFSGCSKLTSLDVSGFDTSKVADMRGTFYDCTQLKSLDVSGFDTSSVTDMYRMFYDCSALTSLDLSGFDTSSVTTMSSMFGWCKALTSLDLSGFDTSSVKEMYGMFYMCSALTSLDVSGFDTSKITNMRAMFSNCSALTSLDLSGFDTSKVTTMDNMFRDCTKLKSVTLGKAFKFVGTNGYLPTPSSTYITGADGKWYDTNTGTGYTPEALASVERTEAVTYSAVPNAKILSGVWKFNKGLGLSRYDINANVPFKSAGKTFSSIDVPSKTANLCFDGKSACFEGTGWTDAAYRLISFNGPQVVSEDFYNWFVENAKPVVTLEGKWKFNETLTFDTEVEATEISYTINGGTGTILYTWYDESGKWPGWKLGVDANIFADVWVYGDTGSGLTPLGWRDESYRTIAFNGTQYVTKDFYDWFIANAKPWSEDESGAAEKIAVPKQSGTLTYTGSAQSPSWSSYDASKMTMGGTTTGTNAGSYTTTFALNDGFKWADGTTGTKSVIWKIGKATGSVSFSKDSLNIDKNSTTDTLDVTRTGTGAITATSSDTSVATVTVNGTKVTVTKVGDGTATITVKVAADANYKEASKTCSVTCVGIPTLAYGSTWYKGSTDKASITKIQIKDSYTPSGTAAESWNADARNSGSIKAYVEGTTLTIAGNGTGKIKANALSWSVFNGFSSATAITGLDLMDTSNALTMEAMFYGCKALTALDVSKFDTSNVTSMRAMFYECENLTSLNVSKFDTASVTNVEAMFQGCKALTAVGDVSGWNTAKVTSMYQVFYGCEKLAALNLSGWNTTNVTNMQAMFLDCTSLTSVGDISGWNTAKVTEMALLFGNCEKLASLDVSKFNTAAVTNMNAMFFNCSALTTLDVSGFDTAKTTNLAAMFSGCVSLTSLDVSNWNTSNVTTMEATFQSCKKLTTMGDVTGWDTSKVTNMREMFCQCNLITSVDVTNWKTGNVTNMNGIFSNCEKLTSVGDLSGWDTSSATDMGWIFNSCFKLTGMGDISQWDTSNATKMNCLFATCESLTELDLSGWDTSKVTDMNNIFGGYEHEQLEESEIAGECVLLRKITLGAKFKFVGTDSYLPEPNSRYISGADGKWYVGSTGYTPAELAGLNRTEAVTYVAVKGTKTMSILSGDNAVSGYSISE